MNNHINILTKTDTGTEPVSLTEAKSHLFVTHTSDDTYITSLITACRQIVEGQINRALVAKTIVAEIESKGNLDLFYPPVAAVTSVLDAEGNAVDYEIVENTITTEISYAKITYTVTASVSESDKWKILELIAYKYARRGDEVKPKSHKGWLL